MRNRNETPDDDNTDFGGRQVSFDAVMGVFAGPPPQDESFAPDGPVHHSGGRTSLAFLF